MNKTRFIPWLIAAVCLPGLALASNGYFSHGYGTASKAMAGAGTALPLDTLSTATNPASIAHIGNRIDLGMAVFNPERELTVDNNTLSPPFGFVTPGHYDSDSRFFLIPSVGYNLALDDDSALGITIRANGGMNTDYNVAVYGGFGAASRPTGVDMAQVFVEATYARRLSEDHSVGIAPVLIIQRFAAEGLEPFQGLSRYPGKVTEQGHDYSVGAALRVGWLGKLSDTLSAGVSVQTRGYMSRFDDYKGLFAEQGDFDIPPQFMAGLAWRATPDLTLLLDYQKILYGDIDSLANGHAGPMLPPANLGGDNGLGFGWEDMDIIKLGAQWRYSDRLTLRAGYSHANEVFDDDSTLFNILAPGIVTDHLTAGFSWKLDEKSEISLSFAHGLKNSASGGNFNTGPQTTRVGLDTNELEISWSTSF